MRVQRRGLHLWMGFIIGTAVLALSFPPPAHAEARSGHIDWDRWSFDWEVRGNTGLALLNVRYDTELVLSKASMPVIRVKYAKEWPSWHPYAWWPFKKFDSTRQGGKCGPFQDRLSWERMRKQSDCGDRKICVDSYFSGGVEWLEIGVFAKIGEYDIYQTWYFSEDGQLNAIVQSGGLSCNTDHDHHPYWRFDFAVKDKDHDQVLLYEPGTPDTGWGPGYTKYTHEVDVVKSPAGSRKWVVRDHPTGHKVWIIPGVDDGSADFFSDRDVSVRLFKAAEDEHWIFGSRRDLGYNEEEDIQETDIVFWYIAHLPHPLAEGAYPAGAFVGPTLRVER